MPTYEYRCPDGHEFERFQRISDPPVADCPECGAAAERLLSPGAGLIFKGSGFYLTDYRSDSYRKAAEADSKANGAGADGSSGGGAGKDAGSGAKPESGGKAASDAPPAAKTGGGDAASK